MKLPAIETSDYLMNDAASELEAFLFADLDLPETETNDVTAGRNSTVAPPPCLGCTWGPPVTNHNETVSYDEADLGELDDLLLTAAQEDNIQAGRNFTSALPSPCPGCNWGPPLTNHNETVADDDKNGMEALADLPLTIAQAEETKAGEGTSTNAGQFPWQLSLRNNSFRP